MKDENKWKAVDSWVRRMILDSLQSKSFVFLHKCLCQNASLFCWKSVSILKTKRNASYYLAGQLLQPSIYRWLEQLTSVRCTNDASSDHLSLTSQNWEKANELKDGDWMWWQGRNGSRDYNLFISFLPYSWIIYNTKYPRLSSIFNWTKFLPTSEKYCMSPLKYKLFRKCHKTTISVR